jgi:hypothetical protein
MDPNACLEAAREAWKLGDYDLAAQHYRDLDAWIVKGGFMPGPWMRAHL